MCLDTVTKIKLDKSGVGWKVYELHKGKLCGDMFSSGLAGKVIHRKVNKWLSEKDFRDKIAEIGSLIYPYGFHIFTSKLGAKVWIRQGGRTLDCVIIKVKYRKGHTLGKQRRHKTIVAKEMLILPNQLKEN